MKLFDKFKKWKLRIQLDGLHVGKFHIMHHKRYKEMAYERTCVCFGVIQEKTAEIKQLQKELILYKQLLDSSQQTNRNYGNRN